MSESRPSALIGIDGGGTSCRFALLSDGRRIEHRAGSANVSSDLASAITTLRHGLEELAAKADLDIHSLKSCTAYVGLAGVMSDDDSRAVAAALPFRRVSVADDRLSSVVGALGNADGAVAGIGTGSFLAAKIGGPVRFVGGWGPVFGDEASGAWLGRRLLSETLLAEDGIAGHSDLTRAVLDEFGGAAGIVAYGRTATPASFALRAPSVVESAERGDETAERLMVTGADYICRSLNALGWTPETPLCLIGGVGPHFRSYLPEAMSSAITPPVGNALDGTLILAAGFEEGAT